LKEVEIKVMEDELDKLKHTIHWSIDPFIHWLTI
jgi:hypothetical protein